MPCVFSQPCSRSWTQPLVVTWCNASSDTSVRRLMAFLGVLGHLCHKSQVQKNWKLSSLFPSCQRSNGYYNNGSIIVCSSTSNYVICKDFGGKLLWGFWRPSSEWRKMESVRMTSSMSLKPRFPVRTCAFRTVLGTGRCFFFPGL